MASFPPTLQHEHREPGPEGVQLPHVAEVAHIGKPEPAFGEHGDRIAGVRVIARLSRCGPGTMAPKAMTAPTADNAAAVIITVLQGSGPRQLIRWGNAEPRASAPIRTPNERPRSVDWDHEAISFSPTGSTGQRDPGKESQRDGRGETVHEEGERSGARGGARGACGEQVLRFDAVGEIEQGRGDSTGGETDLNRCGQPSRGRRAEAPLRAQARYSSGGREPDRQSQNLHQRNEGPLRDRS